MDEIALATTRVTIQLGPESDSDLLARTFRTTWSLDVPSDLPVQLDKAEVARLSTFLGAVRNGDVSFPLIRDAAPMLTKLLGTIPAALPGLIELNGNGTTVTLTDLPWEAAVLGPGPLPQDDRELLAGLFASLPLYRHIPTTKEPLRDMKYRPRVLLVISNPIAINSGRIEVRRIEGAVRDVLDAYPVFQTRVLSDSAPWDALGPQIARFDPHIFIFVGHGSSDPTNTNPTLAFQKLGDSGGVTRVSALEVARRVAEGGTCCLAILVACDLVRQSPSSAAVEFVRSGVDDVVAMQGSIAQIVATKVMYSLLGEVLAGSSVPLGLVSARGKVNDNPHCILPVAFCARGKDTPRRHLRSYGNEYLKALQGLSQRISTPVDVLYRRDLLQEIDTILRVDAPTKAVAIVHGEFGNGVSTALRMVIASLLAEVNTRPAIYIDCEPRRRTVPLSDWVCTQLLAATHKAPVLRPKSASGFAPAFKDQNETAEWAGDWAVQAEISIILDNLEDPPLEEIAFLQKLASRFKGKGKQARLILTGRDLLTEIDHFTDVYVPPLSEAETDEYGRRFVEGVPLSLLYERTKGNLTLLDAERRMPGPTLSSPFAEPTDAKLIDIYMARLDRSLSRDARNAAIRLALFPGPLNQHLIRGLLADDMPEAIAELLRTGVVESFLENDRRSIYISKHRCDDIQRHWAQELDANKDALAQRFLEVFHSGDDALDKIASGFGASTYFFVIQKLLAAGDTVDLAIVLPLFLQGRLKPRELLKMYSYSAEVLDQMGSEASRSVDERSVAEALIAGAGTALDLGESTIAEKWYARVPPQSDGLVECKRLVLKAKLLKDSQQATATREILDTWNHLSSCMAEVSPDEKDEIEALKTDIIIDALPVSLFLHGETAEHAWQRLESLVLSLPDLIKAHIFATLAERAMKASQGQVNWSQVAEWVTQSRLLIGPTQDDRMRTFCFYQEAQYYRKRPEPKPRDACAIYELARVAGAVATENRREALALWRILALERDYPDLRREPDQWPLPRLREADDLTEKLASQRADSLSMRAMGRLLGVSAEITTTLEDRRSRLDEAAQALSAEVLKSRTDDEAFANVCLRRLDLDFSDQAGYHYAVGFVQSLKYQIERRFGISVDIDHPEACLTHISNWLTATQAQKDLANI